MLDPRLTRSILAACLLVLVTIILSYPKTFQVHESVRTTRRPYRQIRRETTCGFSGNSDIYGLGIRLGVYFQWLAALLSKQLLARHNSAILRDVIDVNTIFSLAIFIATALLHTGTTIDPVYGVEVLIMLHIFFGSTYIVSHAQWAEDQHAMSVSFWSGTVCMWINCGASAYATWFWFAGLRDLPVANCGSYAFLFAQVRLDGPAKIFFQITTILNMLLWGLSVLFISWYAAIPCLMALGRAVSYGPRAAVERLCANFHGTDDRVRWREKRENHGRFRVAILVGFLGTPVGEFNPTVMEQNQKAKGKLPKALEIPEWSLNPAGTPQNAENSWGNLQVFAWPCLEWCFLIWSVIVIELIIKWNSITNVYTIQSTGQVIPFIIGIAGLVRVLWALAVRALNKSIWNPNSEIFRLRDKRWAKFPLNKPARRNSWAGK